MASRCTHGECVQQGGGRKSGCSEKALSQASHERDCTVHMPPLPPPVTHKTSQSGHALLPVAGLRELPNSLAIHCRPVGTFFLYPGQTLLINHSTRAMTFLGCIHGRHH